MTAPPDLEARLLDLATALDAPTGEGVAAAVTTRLRTEVVAAPRARRRALRRWALFATAVAAIGAGAAAAPAVADFLGVRGVDVRTDERPAPATTATSVMGASLDLGTNVEGLAAAERVAGFAPVVPATLGPPASVWVDRRGDAPFIALVYADGPLVIEFDATISDDAVLTKLATPETKVEQLEIDGEPAMWIEGIHAVAVRGRDGRPVFERMRLSDRVLLVQHGRLTVRIEVPAGTGRDEAVAIARSLPG